MLHALWQNDSWRALAGGIGYVLLYAFAAHAMWYVSAPRSGQRAAGAPPDVSARMVFAEVLALVGAVGYPFLMVIAGVFSPRDVGLLPVQWSSLWPGLAAAAVGGVLWLMAILWQRGSPAPGRVADTSPGLVAAGALGQEAHLAACRASLMPLLGGYWGVWLGVALRMLSSATSPALQARLASPAERRLAYLDWALDWASAAVFVLLGSLWPGLLLRVVWRVALHLWARATARATQRVPATGE